MIDHVWLNFRFASPRLRCKPVVILRAISWSHLPFQDISDEKLCSNKHFMMQVVAVNGKCLDYAHDTIKDDEDVVSRAILNHEAAIYSASPRLQQNCDMKMRYLLRSGDCPLPGGRWFRPGYYSGLPEQDVLPALLNPEEIPAKLFPFFFEQGAGSKWGIGHAICPPKHQNEKLGPPPFFTLSH